MPKLTPLADYVRAVDAHAAYHVPLLERADALLADPRAAGTDERRALAVKLERWRYQHLGERPWNSAEDAALELADALDLAVNALTARPPRPPRSPRRAIVGQSEDPAAFVARCMNPRTPLDEIIEQAVALTRRHFAPPADADSDAGSNAAESHFWRMHLYAPLYLLNQCINHCTYCGFRFPNRIARRQLHGEEALAEADTLSRRGFRHLLLVAGDFPSLASTDYFVERIAALRRRGLAVSIEIAPQSTDAYEAMTAAGACGVTLYQETYDPALYAEYHPRGTKMHYDWRLEGLERAADAGFRRLGLGCLLGLADPVADLTALMRHAAYLTARFPDRTLAFSLPRIHEAPSGFCVRYPVDDELFVRMYATLRIAFPQAELVLSTRETPSLRDRLSRICITQMSAGSCTAPGGYGRQQTEAEREGDLRSGRVARSGDRPQHEGDRPPQEAQSECRAGEQFPVSDHRSAEEVAAWLSAAGFTPQWDVPA